jgi:hypothetical protein
LLFLIYVNDIFELKLHGSLTLYADDIVIKYSNEDLNVLHDHMEHDLRILHRWCYNNGLTVNANKTSYMFFRDPRRQIPPTAPLFFGNAPITKLNEVKYLGMTIDSELKFASHVENVRKSILPYVFVLNRVRFYVPSRSRLMIYYAHVHSRLTYLNAIWNKASEGGLRAVARLQNKAIRFAFYEEYGFPGVHTATLFKNHEILDFPRVRCFETLLLIFKIKTGLLKSSLRLVLYEDVHGHDTRNKTSLYLQPVHNEFGKRSLTFSGFQMFNRLPVELKSITNLFRFRIELKKYLMDYLTNLLT